MDVATKVLHFTLTTQIPNHKKKVDVFVPDLPLRRASLSLKMRHNCRDPQRASTVCFPAVCAISSGVEETGVSCSQFQDFSVSTNTSTGKVKELKINIEVFGTRTQAIFDRVLSKMVAAAQPIPGFRRVKGGKTPGIPTDILVEVLGPSKVYKQVIKEIINSTVAEYVEKEGLKVTKDLKIEQTFEELEDAFEPGEALRYDAVLQLQAMD